MKALATAGHTDHHLSYLVSLAEGDGSSAPVVCTGGSMLLGSTGRTDLLGVEKAEPLAHAQWRSVRRLLTTLPPDTRIYPTHGFGSFCSSTPSAGDVLAASTIAEEGQKNPAALMDEDVFVVAVLANLPPVPAYYRYMAPLNRRGPLAPRLEPVALLDGARLAEAVKDSEWVVDLRHRRRYAAEHLRGTLNLELGGNLATYLGWLVPFESRFILVAEHEAEVTEARRLVASIGREEVFAAALWPDVAARASGPREPRTISGCEILGPGGGMGSPRGERAARARRPPPARMAPGPRARRSAPPLAGARRAKGRGAFDGTALGALWGRLPVGGGGVAHVGMGPVAGGDRRHLAARCRNRAPYHGQLGDRREGPVSA